MMKPADFAERTDTVVLASEQTSPAPVQQHTSTTVPSRDSVTVEIIRGREAFETLEGEWNALFARNGKSNQLFQQFNWLWHCGRVYGVGPGAPQIIVAAARLAGRLILCWPMQFTCGGGLCQLTWFGDPVGQYGDVLVDKLPDAIRSQALTETWALICETVHPDLVVLRRVRDDSQIAGFLRTQGAHITERNQAPMLDLSAAPSFNAYCQDHQTRHTRKERRRLARRLGEFGKIRYERITDKKRAAEVARKAILLKRQWLLEKSKASKTLSDDKILEFFTQVLTDTQRPVGGEVHEVRCNGELAGSQIAFQCNARLAIHVNVYNSKFQRAGVGVLQLAQTVEEAFGRNLTTIDLLAPKADYKMEWANTLTDVNDYVFAPTARGRIVKEVYIKRMRPALKSLVPMLPQKVRNWASI